MRAWVFAPLWMLLFAAGLVALAVAINAGRAEDRPHRRYLPGIAADSAGAPTATPTPTPIPGPGAGSARRIAMFIEIDAKELSATDTGTTTLHISAQVFAPLPSVDQPVVSATGTWTIAPHPPDEAGCTWTRTVTKDMFAVTFFQTADLSVVANMDAPEWHYTQLCPAGLSFTYPKFGEEGLFHFLLELMAPYRQGAGVKLPMDVVSEVPISCIKRHGLFEQGSTEFTDGASVEVFVYQPDFPGGCLLPAE